MHAESVVRGSHILQVEHGAQQVFFFQAEDGIRDIGVTGVQTCALPICEALMYLHHRGWASGPQFSIETIAGEIRATVLDDRTCRVDMGRARDLGDARSGEWAGRKLEVGNPQFAIRLQSADAVDALELPAIGPPIENDPQFPNRTNVSFWARSEEHTSEL